MPGKKKKGEEEPAATEEETTEPEAEGDAPIKLALRKTRSFGGHEYALVGAYFDEQDYVDARTQTQEEGLLTRTRRHQRKEGLVYKLYSRALTKEEIAAQKAAAEEKEKKAAAKKVKAEEAAAAKAAEAEAAAEEPAEEEPVEETPPEE